MADVTLLEINQFYSYVLINGGTIESVHFKTVDVMFFAYGHFLDGFGNYNRIDPYKAIIKVG
jgi:hypothetical protein